MLSDESIPERASRLAALLQSPLDVLVIGGGITGNGVALDLQLRGLRVGLVEKNDWAAGTSSASSRLIHGGLRYLEHGELGLVRESCLERGLLLRNAAGLVWPERFHFPLYADGPIPRWKLLSGLYLYTALSFPRSLGIPRVSSKRALTRAIPGIRQAGLLGGGSYLDGATNDARLCLAVLKTAIASGVAAVSRLEATAIDGGKKETLVALRDRLTGEKHELRPRAVVLAAGPATDALRERAHLTADWLTPTRGTHILVPRESLPTDGAVILPSAVDGRILFLLPWPRYTVIGTTDVDAAPSQAISATPEEVRYLLDSANALVPGAGSLGGLKESDVISTYAGLRPLLAADEGDPSARSREERFAREDSIYTIAGGKLTGYRSMAEKLGARMASDLGIGRASRVSPTRSLLLHGALPQRADRAVWSHLTEARLPPAFDVLGAAWGTRYGSHAPAVDALCATVDGGRDALSADVLLGEIDWAVREEDCLGAVDFFFRRTDLGLEPREAVTDVAPRVLARLAQLLEWDAERSTREQEALTRALADRHKWRA